MKSIYTFNNEVTRQDLAHKKIGLVLSGGVVRAAAWHVGVAFDVERVGPGAGDGEQDQVRVRRARGDAGRCLLSRL